MTHKLALEAMHNYTINIHILIYSDIMTKKVSFIHILYNYNVVQKKQNTIILQTNCYQEALHI